MDYRTGIGFDVHAFEKGRKLILGGIEIPFEKGLAGHSDADAILHAITDAMLGSLALGDIGSHFPDTDEKFKDAESSIFLIETNALLTKKKYSVNNIDVVVAIQKPKLAPYIQKIRENISSLLNIDKNSVSIKATTTEALGFIGREEGIAAMATVSVVKED